MENNLEAKMSVLPSASIEKCPFALHFMCYLMRPRFKCDFCHVLILVEYDFLILVIVSIAVL